MINKIITAGLIYIVLFTIYMIYSEIQIICPTFWRTYYWVFLVYSFPLTLFFLLKSLTVSVIQLLLIWVIIIFISELLIFNICMVNEDYISWAAYCTSKVFGFIFSGSVVLMLCVVLIINKFS